MGQPWMPRILDSRGPLLVAVISLAAGGSAFAIATPLDTGPTAIAVSDAEVVEGAGEPLVFTIEVSGDVTGPVFVDYETVDDSAVAPTDYEHRSGTVELGYDSRRVSVEVPVVDDAVEEPTEGMTLELSNARGGDPYAPPVTITDGTGIGTIIDDDAPATRLLTIDDPGLGSYVRGPGIDCGGFGGTLCTAQYANGTEIVLTWGTWETLSTSLEGWGKDCEGSTGTACTLVMSSDRSACVSVEDSRFSSEIECTPGFRLTITPPPGDHGMVTGPGIHCGRAGEDCDHVYPRGTEVTLTGIDNGFLESIHRGWGGDCVGTNERTCSLIMTSDRTACAGFQASRATEPAGCVLMNRITIDPRPDGYGAVIAPGIECGSLTGIDAGTDCTELYPRGTSVTLESRGDLGSSITAWGGDCATAATGEECKLTMRGDRHACAVFSGVAGSGPGGCTSYRLSISPLPAVHGRITGPGINCGGSSTNCTEDLPVGADVTLTAAGHSTTLNNSTFVSWGKDCVLQATTTCSLTMNSNRQACATFSGTFGQGPSTCVVTRLTIDPPPGQHGRISGPGISCGRTSLGLNATDCSETYEPGTQVVLHAIGANSSLTGWGRSCSGSAATCTLTMTDDKSACATFAGAATEGPLGCTKVLLKIDPPPGDHGKITGPGIDCGKGPTDCSEIYPIGQAVTLRAHGAPLLEDWGMWDRDCARSQTTTCELVMDGPRTVCASFNALLGPGGPATCSGVPLTIDPPPGKWGLISGPGIRCGWNGSQSFSDCSEVFWREDVQLTASGPLGLATFAAWGKECAGRTASTCTLTMDRARTACATFSSAGQGTGPIGCTHARLSITPPPEGFGHVSGPSISCGMLDGIEHTECDAVYPVGTEVTISAIPRPGVSTFIEWGRNCTGSTRDTCSLHMSTQRLLCASFNVTGVAQGPSGCGTARLTIDPIPSSVAVTGPGIDCGGILGADDCSEVFDLGTEVILTKGGSFGEVWGGACSYSFDACRLVMDTPRTVCIRSAFVLSLEPSGCS